MLVSRDGGGLGSSAPGMGPLPDMVPGLLQATHSPTRLPPRDLAANQLLGEGFR